MDAEQRRPSPSAETDDNPQTGTTAPVNMPKPNLSPKPTLRRIHFLFLLGAPFIALFLLESFARGNAADTFAWITRRPVMFLLNYGLFAGVFWLFALIRKDRVRACSSLLLTAFIGLLGFIHYYKVHYRLEPLLFSDAFQIGSMGTTLQEFPMTIRWSSIITLGLGALLGMMISIRLLPRKRFKRFTAWPVLGVLLLCATVPLCFFSDVYFKNQTDLVNYSREGGVLYTAIAVERQRLSSAYSGYKPEDAEAAWQEIKALTTPDKPDIPNIILILSEAFFDQAHFEPYLQFTEPIMPFYSELIKTCISGQITVPKQGGGTSETEFEVLTGLCSQAAINPYSMGLPELNSMAAVMRERGYKATALHWYSAVFYNRFKNLRQLGFDELHTTDTTVTPFQKVGPYVSDAAHYRSILRTLKSTPQKDFIFCITMQNHFPYDKEDYTVKYGASVPFANELSDRDKLALTNFCYLLGQSDKALEDFLTELIAFEEPTIVVFFSDHIPPLGNDLYERIGMPVQTDVGKRTPYFIWSNRENTAEQVNLQAWQLGGLALAQAGITSDPFFHYIEMLRDSGVNKDGICELLAYDAQYGEQAAYQSEGIRVLSDNWQIGGVMNLMRVYAELIGDKVYILPQLNDPSQYFKLSANGQKIDDWCIYPTDMPLTIECVLTNSRGALYNHSGSLAFTSTDDLLEKAEEIPKAVIPLGEERFTIVRQAGGYVVAATERRFAAQSAALLVDGKRMEWQQAYAINRAGRFHVVTENAFKTPLPMTVAIAEGAFEGYEMTGEGVRRYMEEKGGVLMLLGAWSAGW